MKRELPLAITFIVAMTIVAAYFFNVPSIISTGRLFESWGVLVSAFALGLAAVNLIRVHADKISRRSRGWIYSIMLLVSMVGVIFLGLTQGITSTAYRIFFTSPRTALGATIYAMLGYYIASASYRAFVAKNTDATILLVSASIVLLGQTPYGEQLWRGFAPTVSWLLNVPNMAAQRGIIIGAAVGAVALSLRVAVGLERSYMGMDK